jgi:tol-pal system protein YbgF
MSIARIGIFMACVFVLAGCASRGDVEVMQHDVDELKTRYFNMEKDFSGLKSETINSYKSEIESLRKGTADLQASLESAKVDMQVLAGKVDDASMQTKKPVEEISLLREDLDRRLNALEARIGILEKKYDEMTNKSGGAPAKQPDVPPEVLYQQGVDQVKGGNTQKGRETLTAFLEKYSSNDLAPNAHYWIGESYYTEKSYDQAILEFEKVIKNYPDKGKAPAAMLKQGLAFKAIGDKKSGSYILNKLIEKYPRSPEAATAKVKLKK